MRQGLDCLRGVVPGRVLWMAERMGVECMHDACHRQYRFRLRSHCGYQIENVIDEGALRGLRTGDIEAKLESLVRSMREELSQPAWRKEERYYTSTPKGSNSFYEKFSQEYKCEFKDSIKKKILTARELLQVKTDKWLKGVTI